MKKYDLPKKYLKNEVLNQMINDFRKNCREHMKDLTDKMKRLGIQ